MKEITILGSTGSIGINTLNVLAQHQDKFNVFALAAKSSVDIMARQCIEWSPRYAVMVDDSSADKLQSLLLKKDVDTEVLSGLNNLEMIASHNDVDYVMAAIVGAAGLLPTLAAANSGKRVLLANKEALVMSGPLFMEAVKSCEAVLLPIDSEHNAIFQCMPSDFSGNLAQSGVKRILLTASGGPFRKTPLNELPDMTPDQACAHPNWDMGRKISVDSATMMNKGLEIIEACWLFQTDPEHIQVVIHPQSIIHSMVEYSDGSVLAHMGNPDMRTPIAHALSWPDRMEAGVKQLDLFKIAKLEFEIPDYKRFPCLLLAREAMQTGGTATAILNAANEIAVEKFLAGEIRFTDIARVVEYTLESLPIHRADSLQTILDDDTNARKFAMNFAVEQIHA
jgi:1-deoxy-D-xylulose-5-phosphate reductoisomerase